MPKFADAIVETTRQPFLVLDDGLTVKRANGAFYRQFGVSEKEARGRLIYELGDGQWDIPELRRLLGEILPRKNEIEDFRVEHGFETLGRRVMLLNARRLRHNGKKDRVLLSIDDITERERIETDLSAGREFADKLVDSIREGLLVLDRDLRVKRVNQPFCEIFQTTETEARGKLIYELGDGQWDIPALREALEEVLPANKAFDDFEVMHDFPGVGRRTMLLNARELDHLPQILLAIRDVTEARRHETGQKLLVGELQHRVKNILSNVQAIATATLSRSASVDEFESAFMARLSALGRAQELIMHGASGEVEFGKLVRTELGAHGWEEDGRLTINGEKVLLARRETQAMAMLIHELTTNAIKYGAFSGEKGRVDIDWRIEPRPRETRLRLRWRESSVPAPSPPKNKGFGMELIEGSVSHMLGGESNVAFTRDGLSCIVNFPLSNNVAAHDGGLRNVR